MHEIDYKIKQIPEDFYVEEIIPDNLISNTGDFYVFKLKKINVTTEEAVQKICKRFNIQRKFVGYAGNKDKSAVAIQFISIKRSCINLESFLKKVNESKNIFLEFFGYSENPISLGDLNRNKFIISIRSLPPDLDLEKIKKRSEIDIPNYFDEQRFSSNNAGIGKNLVKRNYEKAISLILGSKGTYEADVNDFLRKNRTNFIGALRIIPKKILTLYMNSYQSLLYNRTVEKYLISKLKAKDYSLIDYSNGRFVFPLKKVDITNFEIPLVGFMTELEIDDSALKKIIEEIISEEKISQRDFIFKDIPEISSAGFSRKIFMKAQEFKIIGFPDDDINKGKKKLVISFELEKGCYATIFLRYLLLG